MIKRAYLNFLKMSDAKKSALAFMFASIIQQGISFLITPLFTRILSTEEFGLVTVYNSWVEIIGTVAMLSLASGIFSVGMIDYEKDRDGFTSALLGLSNIASIITMILFFCGSILFPKIINLPLSLFVLMLIYFIFYPATRFWMARQRFEYKYKLLTIVTIISAFLSPIIGLIAVLSLKGNLGEIRLWGTNSVLITVGFIFYISILKKNKNMVNKEIWKYALKFSIPLLPHYLSMHLLATSDRVMIQSMIGSSAAGIYGLAYTASMIISFVWTAIQGSLTPYVYDCLKKDRLKKIGSVAQACIFFFSLICFFVVLIAPELMLVLGGKKYISSISLIPPLLAAVYFMELYNLFSMIEFYYKKTVGIMISTLLAAIINIIMNYFAIQKFGYVAAAYTTLICYAIYCFFHYLNMKRIESRKIYDNKFLLFYSIIYIVICLLSLIIYPYWIIRYILLIILLIIIFIKRKSVMEIVFKR